MTNDLKLSSCLYPSQVMVVVAESWMFEFVSPDNGGFSLDNVRKASVLSQNITTLLFPIRATSTGRDSHLHQSHFCLLFRWVYKTVLVKVIHFSVIFYPKIKKKKCWPILHKENQGCFANIYAIIHAFIYCLLLLFMTAMLMDIFSFFPHYV